MKRRYAVCGVSGRAIAMWIAPIYKTFSEQAELVGMLDIDPQRFAVCRKDVPETKDVPTYLPDEYDKMIEETRPDAVFVVSKDCYHAHYIIKSLEKDLDVITEKPMTTNWEDAIRVREAEKKSKAKTPAPKKPAAKAEPKAAPKPPAKPSRQQKSDRTPMQTMGIVAPQSPAKTPTQPGK